MSITGILIAAACVGIVGIFVGLFLGVAGIKFKVEVDERELTEAGIMGLIISAAGAAVMVLGIVLFILQAGKISSQAKKDANREKPVMDEEPGSTAPLTADSDGRDGEPLGDTVGFDK